MVTGVIVLSHRVGKLSFLQAVLRNIDQVILSPLVIILVMRNVAAGNLINRGLGDQRLLMWCGFVMLIWTGLELLTMLFNSKRRAIHDYIAGTVVIRQPVSERVSGYSKVRWALIVLFVAGFIVPRLLPEKNKAVSSEEASPPDQLQSDNQQADRRDANQGIMSKNKKE